MTEAKQKWKEEKRKKSKRKTFQSRPKNNDNDADGADADADGGDDDVWTDIFIQQRLLHITRIYQCGCCWTRATIKSYQIDVSWIYTWCWIPFEIVKIFGAKHLN